MTLIKPMFLFLIALYLTFAQAARFDVINRCSYTVWPAALPGGGRRLNPGQTWPLDVAAGTQSARIWARTGCNFDGSGRGGCQTGDCGGVLNCRLSGKPPTTLAEYSLSRPGVNFDSFDISVIDGFNVPMEFSPTSTNGCNTNGLRCNNAQCPDAYHNPGDTRTFTCPAGKNYRVVFCP